MPRTLWTRAWPVVAVVTSLVIFAMSVLHGRWVSGLVFAMLPVLFLVRMWVKPKTFAGLPAASWLLVVLMWTLAVSSLVIATKEAFSDQPYHAQIAVTVFLMGSVWGLFDVLLTIRLSRMLRHRA